MPQANSRGQVAGGVAGGTVSIDNVPIAQGGCVSWLSADTIIYNGPDENGRWVLRTYNQVTHQFATVNIAGANFIGAGGNRYAAQAGSTYANFDFAAGARSTLTDADNRSAASLDGCIALCSDNACTAFDAYWPDGTVDHVDAIAYKLCIVAKGQYVWDSGSFGYTVKLPVPMIRKRVVRLADGDWIVGYTSGIGLVAMLNGATDGYVLVPVPQLAYFHDAQNVNGQLFVCYASSPSEAPSTNLSLFVDRTRPRVPITPVQPPVSVPLIGKKAVLAWFSDQPTPAPANCTFRVAFTSIEPPGDNLIRDPNETPLAQYVASEADPSQIEVAISKARALHPTLPVVIYWPRSLWTKHCSADIYGLEAFQLLNEPSAAFSQVLQAEIVRHSRVWLVAQGYHENPANTPNTADVVPVIATLTRDNANVDGILAFNAGTRPGGWNDLDGRTQQAWQDLFHSITGVPVVKPITSYKKLRRPKMQAFRGFVKVTEYYTGVDPTHPKSVYYNRPGEPNQGGGWEEVQFTPHDNGNWDALYVAANVQLSVQQAGGLQTRPEGTFGPFEMFQIRQEDDTQRLVIYRDDLGGGGLFVEVKK